MASTEPPHVPWSELQEAFHVRGLADGGTARSPVLPKAVVWGGWHCHCDSPHSPSASALSPSCRPQGLQATPFPAPALLPAGSPAARPSAAPSSNCPGGKRRCCSGSEPEKRSRDPPTAPWVSACPAPGARVQRSMARQRTATREGRGHRHPVSTPCLPAPPHTRLPVAWGGLCLFFWLALHCPFLQETLSLQSDGVSEPDLTRAPPWATVAASGHRPWARGEAVFLLILGLLGHLARQAETDTRERDEA